jgi:hypothetical protein
MTKFTSFDKTNLKALRAEMQAVLEKYGVSSNLEFEVGSMRFASAEVDIKVSAKVRGAKTLSDGILESKAKALGLKMKNKDGDQLVEYKTRNWKMPFVYKSGTDGKLYKCDERGAKIRFAA